MDDVTTESSLHPGAAVIPAALAVAEEIWPHSAPPQRKAEQDDHDRPIGTRVLESIVAGYEVTIRVGNALGAASAYKRGFHPTGIAGVFGAAVAAAKLMGLDASGVERAMGIAGTMASGSLEYLSDGSWTKRLNPGWAAHAGVVAAGLAGSGFTGPATVFDGPHGLLRGYTDAPDPERLTEDLGDGELQVMRVSIKPYGCCRYSHGLIDAVLALRPEFDLGTSGVQGAEPPAGERGQRPRLSDIESIRLGVLSGGWPLIAEDIERKRDPQNIVDAQFSAPYAAAVALIEGRAGLAEFERMPHKRLGDDARGRVAVRDQRLRDLMSRTECYRDPSLDAEYPKSWPAAVEIKLRDGHVLKKRIEHALGEPEDPIKRDALVERFVEMLIPRLDPEYRTDELLEMVARKEQQAREAADRILHLERERDLSVLGLLA